MTMDTNLLRVAFLLLLFAKPDLAVAAEPVTVTLYKEPDCTTCGGWVEHLRANGFAVVVHEVADAESLRRKLHVPERHASCHTAEVGGYVIEVPAADIKRLLTEHPDARGLAVPGMPQVAPAWKRTASIHLTSSFSTISELFVYFTNTGADLARCSLARLPSVCDICSRPGCF